MPPSFLTCHEVFGRGILGSHFGSYFGSYLEYIFGFISTRIPSSVCDGFQKGKGEGKGQEDLCRTMSTNFLLGRLPAWVFPRVFFPLSCVGIGSAIS